MPAESNISTIQTSFSEESQTPWLDQMVETWNPPNDRERQLAIAAVSALAEHAIDAGGAQSFDELQDFVAQAIEELVFRLNEQINEIVHHPKYQELYATWRGIEYLFEQTSGETFELRVLAADKDDMRRDLRRAKGDHRRSGLFHRLAHEYHTPGGKPYSFAVFDQPFSQEPGDVQLLTFAAKIAQDAHFLVLGAASSQFFGSDSIQDIPNHPDDLTQLFTGNAYIKWREFRETDAAKHVGLVLPRVLMRPAFDPANNPAEGVDFYRETIRSHDDLAWGNPAYAFAARIGMSLRDTGFPAAITGVRGGGKVDDLPLVTFPTDHGQVHKPPIEIELDSRFEWSLSADLGFIPLVPTKGTSHAVFYGAPSVQIPPKSRDPKTSATASLRAQLPHSAVCNRIAHHVNHILRNMVGMSLEPREVEEELQSWLNGLCLANPESATPEQKAERPFTAAKVTVIAINGETGYYEAILELVPHQKLIAVKGILKLQSEIDHNVES